MCFPRSLSCSIKAAYYSVNALSGVCVCTPKKVVSVTLGGNVVDQREYPWKKEPRNRDDPWKSLGGWVFGCPSGREGWWQPWTKVSCVRAGRESNLLAKEGINHTYVMKPETP